MVKSHPEDASQSSGFIGAAGPERCKVVESTFDYFDYGKNITPVPVCLIWELQVEGRDSPVRQPYSAGNSKLWRPTEDKDDMEPTPENQSCDAPNDQTTYIFLMQSLLDSGYDPKLLKDVKAGQFVGLEFEVVQKMPPERPGLDQSDQTRKPKPVPVCTKIFAMPSENGADTAKEKAGSKSKAKTASKKGKESVAASAAADQESSDAANAAITNALVEAEGKIERKTMVSKVLKHVEDQKMRPKVVALLQNDEWMTDEERSFRVEEGFLVL